MAIYNIIFFIIEVEEDKTVLAYPVFQTSDLPKRSIFIRISLLGNDVSN